MISPRSEAPEPFVEISDELLQAATTILVRSGMAQGVADLVVEDLVANDHDGYPTHGITRVIEYATKVRTGLIQADATPSLVNRPDNGGLLVEGGFAPGAVVRRFVVAELIKRLESQPSITAHVAHSGHLGRIGGLCKEIALSGYFSLIFANGGGGALKVAPPGGVEPRLATNPIAFGCPMPDGAPMVVDVSTSATTDGAVKLARGEADRVPEGRLGSVGKLDLAGQGWWILPLGGLDAGHKGFALSLVVEVLAGVLAGQHFSTPGRQSNGNAAFIIAFSPSIFGRSGEAVAMDLLRLEAFVTGCPTGPGDAIRLPGRGTQRDERPMVQLSVARAIYDFAHREQVA